MKNNWPKIDNDLQSKLSLALGFVVIWILLRAFTPFPYIFPDDGAPRLSGVDSYFHLRHAEFITEHFPEIKRWDSMASFPGVERGINQGAYDVAIAALSKLSFGALSPTLLLIWASPVFSALAFLLVGIFLWRRVKPWCAVLFGCLITAYPGPLVQICALGNGDHHSYEILLATALALSLNKALHPKSKLLWVLCPALILVLFLFSWAGAPLHLAIVGACFFARAFFSGSAAENKMLALKGILFGLIIVALPYASTQIDENLMLWKSAHTVFFWGGCALIFGYPLLVYLAAKLPGRSRLPVAISLVVAFPLLAQLSEPASKALSQLFSPRSSTISEHGAITLFSLFSWYGFNMLALVLTPILLVHNGRAKQGIVAYLYGASLVLFWLQTKDFNYYAPAVVAATAAYCLAQLPWEKWVPIFLLGLIGLPFLPLKAPINPWLSPSEAKKTIFHTDGLDQGAQWLAEFKKTVGKSQIYGIMAPWDLGSLLAQLTQTPVGWSQTHSQFLAELFYSDNSDYVYERLVENKKKPFRFIFIPSRNLEEKFGTEYILSGKNPNEIFSPGPRITWKNREFQVPLLNDNYRKTLLVQLFDGLGSNQGHYRLVFESPQQMVRAIKLKESLEQFEYASLDVTPREAEALGPILRKKNTVHPTSRGLLINPFLSPDVRIFEFVPGAGIVGKARRDARIGVFLSISAPYDKAPKFVTWKTYADSEGNFELRLPYPTDGPIYPVPGTIRVNGSYTLDIAGRTKTFQVTEAEIQSGAKIHLDLGADS